MFVSYPNIHFLYSQLSKRGEFLFDSLAFRNSFSAKEMEDQIFLSNLTEIIESESTAIRVFA